MTKKLLLSLLLALSLCLSFVAAEVYDDFSGNELDVSKWTEMRHEPFPFTDEHFVDTSEGVYHIKQNNIQDARTYFIATREFQDGDVLEFDLSYNSGTGNNLAGFATRLYIDGNIVRVADNLVGGCSTLTAGCGPIGYWNGLGEVGNQIGTYHIRMEFYSDGFAMTTTRPDSTQITHTYAGLSAPFSPIFRGQTGADGTIHVDYDNFILNPNGTEEDPNPNYEELEARVESLETSMSNLQDENVELRTDLDSLTSTVDSLQSQLDAHLSDTTMEERVSALETGMNDLNDRVDALKVSIDDVYNKLKELLNSAVTKLQAQLDDHEERISKLEKLHPRIWKDNFPWFGR